MNAVLKDSGASTLESLRKKRLPSGVGASGSKPASRCLTGVAVTAIGPVRAKQPSEPKKAKGLVPATAKSSEPSSAHQSVSRADNDMRASTPVRAKRTSSSAKASRLPQQNADGHVPSPTRSSDSKRLLRNARSAQCAAPSNPTPNDPAASPETPQARQALLQDHPSTDCSADLQEPVAARTELPSNPLINAIRELHRKRQDLHGAEKRLTLQIKAICRRVCDNDKDEGNRMYAALKKGDEHPKAIHLSHLQTFFTAQTFFEDARGGVEDQLEERAKALPIAAWMKTVKGFGIGSLAAIVGEAGDLASYSNHSKLWKRFGLAPFHGKALSSCKGSDLTKDEWVEAGYSPSRRSIVWNVGACLLKSQSARIDKETGEVKAEAGTYRQVYDARREYETARGIAKAQAHARAQRYMEKRFLRDLWRAWRDQP